MCAALAVAACAGQIGGLGANGGQTEQKTAEQALQGGLDASLWRSGIDAERNNQYAQAVGSFVNLYNRNPDNVTVVTALVRNLRYDGRAKEAVRLVEERAQEQLSDPELKFEYAKAQLAAGQKLSALNTLSEVEGLLGDAWQVFSAKGIALDALGRYDQAIEAYGRALELSPDNPVILNNLAMSQAMGGRLQSAISTLETAAGLNRSNPHIRQNLALLYAVNGQEDKAKALASMDLSASDLENNLTFYRRFGGELQ